MPGTQAENSGAVASESSGGVVAGRSVRPRELARARHGVVALNAHAIKGTNVEREQGAAKGTIAGRMSRDAVTFRGRSRASVTVDRRPDDSCELVRARRSVAALNAHAMGGASAKREQGAAKGTIVGNAGDGTVPSGGCSRELALKRSTPQWLACRSENVRRKNGDRDLRSGAIEASESNGDVVRAGGSHGELSRCRCRSSSSAAANARRVLVRPAVRIHGLRAIPCQRV